MDAERGSGRFELVAFRDIASPDDFGELAGTTLELARATFGHIEDEARIRAHLAADFVALGLDAASRRALGLTLLRIRSVTALDEVRRGVLSHLDPATTIGYLHGSAILPEAQGSGLYRRLNRRRMEEIVAAGIGSVLTTTQNPKVERGLTSICEELREAGAIAGWDLERSVLPGIYGQLLTPHQPSTAGTPFEPLDREAGDAFSLLFTLTFPERTVP